MLKKTVLLLLAGSLLLCGCLAARAELLSQSERYAALQEQLHACLNGESGAMPLDDLTKRFESLGSYMKSAQFGYYTAILRDAEAGEDSRLALYTRLLRMDADFCAMLPEQGFPTVDEVEAYALGRQAQEKGDWNAAIGYYEQSIAVMDSMTRVMELLTAGLSAPPTPEPTPLPTPTSAPIKSVVGNYSIIEQSSGTCSITQYLGNDTNVIVPEYIGCYQVVGIGSRAFYDCDAIQSVTIPGCVESIGSEAFYQCSNLNTVVLLEGVQRIGASAFRECTSLAEIRMPSSLRYISSLAFFQCESLTSVQLPAQTAIEGTNPFYWCTNLRSISCSDQSSSLYFANGALFDMNSNTLICYLNTQTEESYTVPDGTSEIGACAFVNNPYLKKIAIPKCVTHIGTNPFRACSNLEFIDVAFDNPQYTSYNGALIDRTNNTLLCCPAGTPIADYVVPEGIAIIGQDAFSECMNIKTIDLPDTLVAIGGTAFAYCTALESITIPNGVTHLGGGAFNWCPSLRNVHFPDSLTHIDYNPFIGSNQLVDINLSSSHPSFVFYDGFLVRKEDNSLIAYFEKGDESDLTLPYGITEIGAWAIVRLDSIERIVLPDSVQSVGNYCFENSSNLQVIQFPSSVSKIGTISFSTSPQTTLRVPANSYAQQYAIENNIPYTTY